MGGQDGIRLLKPGLHLRQLVGPVQRLVTGGGGYAESPDDGGDRERNGAAGADQQRIDAGEQAAVFGRGRKSCGLRSRKAGEYPQPGPKPGEGRARHQPFCVSPHLPPHPVRAAPPRPHPARIRDI